MKQRKISKPEPLTYPIKINYLASLYLVLTDLLSNIIKAVYIIFFKFSLKKVKNSEMNKKINMLKVFYSFY